MSKLNKSYNHTNFLKYISKKIEYNKKVNNQYNTEYVKKIKWFGYLNIMKHENNLLNHIENVNTNQKEKNGIETNKINLLNSKSNKLDTPYISTCKIVMDFIETNIKSTDIFNDINIKVVM